MTVALYEDFDSAVGVFSDYDTYDAVQRDQIANQQHADIRSFIQTPIQIPYTVFDLDGRTITSLDGQTMQQFETAHTIVSGESWTAGTIGVQPDRNNFNGISLSCTTGTNTTSSVIQSGSSIVTIDLGPFSTKTILTLPLLFPETLDYISLSLPAYPTGNINAASSFLDLTSNPTGNFAVGPTDSIPFSASTAPLLAGDCEARLPLSYLVNCDKTKITAVRLRIQATANCTFRCLAIRCFSSTWKYAPVDQNTLYDRLVATVPPAGGLTPESRTLASLPLLLLQYNYSLSQAYTFPTRSGSPSDWPILFRADPVTVDPTPIDMEIGTAIHIGTSAGTNTFSLYLRESSLLRNKMSDLDPQTMAQLAATGKQPDTATVANDLAPNTMSDLDVLTSKVLDTKTIQQLEQTHPVSTRFLAVTLNWGVANALHIKDEAGNGYDFSVPNISPHEDYYMLTTLQENSLRVRIYPMSAQGYINWNAPAFDSTSINDSSLIFRHKGRFGWYAHLADGDTYIKNVRPRYTVHNEYRSLPLASHTPVEGAQIFASTFPDQDLYNGSIPRTGTKLSLDLSKSQSGRCLRLDCDGSYPAEGLTTAPMRFENLQESSIEFDLLAPVKADIAALLIGEGRLILLYIPPYPNGHWQHISIPLDQIGELYQPGEYSLILIQQASIQSTWYVDNLSIPTRSIAWAGRQAADPWKMNNPLWIPFNSTINTPYDGVLFPRGNQIQIRGRALNQTAQIDNVKILPKYAQLGNFVWDDQAPTYLAGPTPIFGIYNFGSSTSTTVRVDGRASSAPNGLANYYWSFGDETFGSGPVVTHTYMVPGVYDVTLTVIDKLGLKASLTKVITQTTSGHVSLPLVLTQ